MNQINIMQKKCYFVDVLLAHNIDNDLTYKIYSENKPTIGYNGPTKVKTQNWNYCCGKRTS